MRISISQTSCMNVVPAIMAVTKWRIPQIIVASIALGKLVLIEERSASELVVMPISRLVELEDRIALIGPMIWAATGELEDLLLSLIGESSCQVEINDSVSDLVIRLYWFLLLRGPHGDGGEPLPIPKETEELLLAA